VFYGIGIGIGGFGFNLGVGGIFRYWDQLAWDIGAGNWELRTTTWALWEDLVTHIRYYGMEGNGLKDVPSPGDVLRKLDRAQNRIKSTRINYLHRFN